MQLSSWPLPAVALVFVATGLVLLGAIAAASARFSPWRKDADAQAAVVDIAKLIGGIVGLFLIFVLTQSMAYYREAEVATAKEAGNILQLDHALAGVAPVYGLPARRLLQEYVGSVVEAEWPEMRRHSRGSEDTEHALSRLQLAVAVVLAQDSAAAALNNVQKNLDDVEDNRTARTGAAESGLPLALWQTMAALFALLAATLFLMDPAARVFRLFAVYLASLTLLAALLFMVDGPYRGEFSVTPRPLQRVLSRMLTQ